MATAKSIGMRIYATAFVALVLLGLGYGVATEIASGWVIAIMLVLLVVLAAGVGMLLWWPTTGGGRR